MVLSLSNTISNILRPIVKKVLKGEATLEVVE